MKLTKYIEFIETNNSYYAFNLNNGGLLKLNKDNYIKLQGCKNSFNPEIFSADEIRTLTEQQFLVENEFDNNQRLINKMTYNVAKYNYQKDSLKIDFALTNNCNFCCPYCFEKNNLCKNKYSKDVLYETGNQISKYIQFLIKKDLRNLTFVFYGGEPTLEKDFIISFINQIKSVSQDKINLKYVFITNGYLFDNDFIQNISSDECDFIQITIDGEKDFHNSRRTNFLKENTFDIIIQNCDNLLKNGFKVVIRLNVDKTNYISVYNFINNIENILDKSYFGKNLFIDIARVFGCDDSFDLYEYESYREKIVDLAIRKNLMSNRLTCKDLTTFCIAESLSSDLVIDYAGNLYRCWNNVFDDKYKIGTLKQLEEHNYDPWNISNITLDLVENYSLNNVNNQYCFECKYVKYCQGLCPVIRKNILLGDERNIYLNDECKEIIRKRIKQLINFAGGNYA